MAKVAIIMGSSSDFNVVKEAIDTLGQFGVESIVKVMSAHRTPDEVAKFVKSAKKEKISVFIGCAGKAAHLAGVIAAHTTLPVIGLPIQSSTMDGLDSLLSTVQMPSGVPVATVAINGAKNAALLAIQMLAISDKSLAAKLAQFKADMAEKINRDNKEINAKLAK